jgi:hypothetical protein
MVVTGPPVETSYATEVEPGALVETAADVYTGGTGLKTEVCMLLSSPEYEAKAQPYNDARAINILAFILY